jgi:hypothetical protein
MTFLDISRRAKQAVSYSSESDYDYDDEVAFEPKREAYGF